MARAEEALSALTGAGLYEVHTEVRLRDGTVEPAWVQVTAVLDEQGQAVGGLVVLIDESTRVAHARELESARDYLATLTSSMADGLVVIDRDGTVRDANRAAAELLGHPARDALLGRPAAEVLFGDPGVGSRLLDPGADARESDDVFVRGDGRRLAVAWTSADLQAPPLVEGRVVVFRDNTARLRREEQLREEAEGLRWAHRVHGALDEDRFVLAAQPIVELASGRVVSHELLLRMREGEGEGEAAGDGALIESSDFLPSAEQHGLMPAIDAWVLRQAADVVGSGLDVHLNLSGRSIGNPDVMVRLKRIVRQAGGDPSR